MSDFAQRLIARSAGTPPLVGCAMLAPRPRSRFESSAGLEIEPAPEIAAPMQTPVPPAQGTAPAPVPGSMDSRLGPRPRSLLPDALAQPSEDMGRNEDATPIPQSDPMHWSPPVVDDVRPIPGPFALRPHEAPSAVTMPVPHVDTETAIRHDPPTPAGDDSTPTEATAPVTIAKPAPPSATGERTTEIRTIAFERLPPAALDRRAAFREPTVPPPEPSISIGTVEVHFLPPEPPAIAPRPQPERTRGFAAYARARRGEPH
jgi:hypothetical protein